MGGAPVLGDALGEGEGSGGMPVDASAAGDGDPGIATEAIIGGQSLKSVRRGGHLFYGGQKLVMRKN